MRDTILSDPAEIARTLPGILARDDVWRGNFNGPVSLLISRGCAHLAALESRGRTAVLGRGDVGAVLGLLERHGDRFAGSQVAFLPYGIEQTYPGQVTQLLGLPVSGAWEWLSCSTATPFMAGEERCGPLAPTDDEAVRDLLRQANPVATTLPGDPSVTWWGYRDSRGELLSVCAMSAPGPDGGVHLASFGTHPDLRGQGIGSALLAAITRAVVSHGGYVHFGVWIDNQDAVRLYRRLGYQTGAQIQMYRR